MHVFSNVLVIYLLYKLFLHFRVYVQGSNLRTEPKFIVFLSHLLSLFRFCPACKTDNPLVEISQNGTLVAFHTLCSNSECPQKESVWCSQPMMDETKIPAGNFLLSMAVLVAGGSASKTFQIFSNMGLQCISLNTFFRHQRVC